MCKHYALLLVEEDRHYINSLEHNNCVLCLSEDRGPMTQSEIAEYLGLSKMRVCQIEHQAKTKLGKHLKRALHPF